MPLVQVTLEDIDNGFREDCQYCPVARALRRVLLPEFVGEAQQSRISIYNANRQHWEEELWSCATPMVANQFINDFDKKREVKPFEFELDIPDEYLKCP